MIRAYYTTIAPGPNVSICLSPDDYATDRGVIHMIRGDIDRAIVSINACFYLTQANLTLNTEFLLGTITEPIARPNASVIIPVASMFAADNFRNQSNTPFTGVQETSPVTVTITTDGEIRVRITAVTTPAQISGTNYVLIPINASFTNLDPIAFNNS